MSGLIKMCILEAFTHRTHNGTQRWCESTGIHWKLAAAASGAIRFLTWQNSFAVTIHCRFM